MNRVRTSVVLALGLIASGSAAASGAFTGRVGATVGSYQYEDEVNGVANADYDSGQYGVLLGLGLTAGRFFGDVGIEQFQYAKDRDTDGDFEEDDPYYRSDFLVTLGAFLGDHWTVFGGYRHSTQGDGVFADDGGYTADGPLLGGGVSFRAGKKIGLGASAAYNFLSFSQDGQVVDDFDLDGISVKLQMNFVGTPHAIWLRGQRFTGEQSFGGGEYEATEDYFNIGYQATFGFASW